MQGIESLKSKCSDEQGTSNVTLRKLNQELKLTRSQSAWKGNVQSILERVSHVSGRDIPSYYLDVADELGDQKDSVDMVVNEHRNRVNRTESIGKSASNLYKHKKETMQNIKKQMTRIKTPLKL